MLEELTPWDRVQLARSVSRPTSLDFIGAIFNKFMELHGDRVCRDDGAIVAGLASIDEHMVTVIGQQKGRSMKENKKRNYGMPYPDGYRKALRLMKQAEKFHRPIICFIDTPGAFCGIEAEERGQGEAIAKNLYEMSGIKVPILSIVIGEGGSGGALALGVANQVWMLENATYSILSPEGFASILWKDSKRAKEAADIMKITAKDLKNLDIIEKVIPEDLVKEDCVGKDSSIEKDILTTNNIEKVACKLRCDILLFLNEYKEKTEEEIVTERYERFRGL